MSCLKSIPVDPAAAGYPGKISAIDQQQIFNVVSNVVKRKSSKLYYTLPFEQSENSTYQWD